MPRKTRKSIEQTLAKPQVTRYSDAAPQWIRNLIGEVEELADLLPDKREWRAPKRVKIQFSEKDADKEEQRYAAIQRKGKRGNSRR